MHILDAILEIESYIGKADFSVFIDNSMMRFACIKQMEIIGEACNHISDETKLRFSSVEWSQIVGMRNVFVHEYFGVDANLVWEIIKNDIPDLKVIIMEIISTIE
jgi:uncharacterized protein with HEPN domain